MKTTVVTVAGFLMLMAATPLHAQAPAAATAPKADVTLTAEELKEREARHSCKVALCSAFYAKSAVPGDLTCDVLKTWRKEQLDKMMARGKLSWPWGNARCTTKLKFERAKLQKAISEPAYEATFDTHKITCELEREKDVYAVNVDMTPKVTFKDGKAVKAALNWGKIDAPLLAKSALWSATAADNTFGFLQGTVVDDINDFLGSKCEEVKSEWQKK
ncbi:MAG TPA: hypothetical protein PK970_10115 [Hyphomicrobiaceae bacterium]|nr:hypothetical protein [Hyphomicrobiaceae bacterium]